MKWVKFRIKTVTDAEDIIISTLYEIGLEGAQIEDKVPLTALEKEQMFVDILPEGPEDDGIAYLSFFVELEEDGSLKVQGESTDRETLLERVRAELEELRNFCDIGEGSISVDETEDIDWINNWKQYFHQFTIDDILVIPSWEEVEETHREGPVLHIDPGTAFGTGMHETTQLCIRQLRKYMTCGARLLDVGTGSGILGILSLMFGAGHVVGTDLDVCAVEAVAENCQANGIAPEQFELLIGNLITDPGIQARVGFECYDIVVANILADVLVPLTPVIVNQLKEGGIYITSGIIDDKEDVVTEAVKAAGLKVLEVTYQGEWVSVTAQKIAEKERQMYQFFVEPGQIHVQERRVVILGEDVNHIRNVLRMRPGEEINVSDGLDGKEYRCGILALEEDKILCELRFVKEAQTELPSRICLFQGIPKGDKMEWIVQKAVELGVSRIVPVAMKRCVVKLEEKKARARVARWQGIAEAAAKQSRRGMVPEVADVMTFPEAVELASSMDMRLAPYELAQGMAETRRLIDGLQPGMSVAVFIGPEGGFDEAEIGLAEEKGIRPITLGKRILRTETAGLTVLSWMMYRLEEA